MLEIKSQHLTLGGHILQTTYLQILYSGRAVKFLISSWEFPKTIRYTINQNSIICAYTTYMIGKAKLDWKMEVVCDFDVQEFWWNAQSFSNCNFYTLVV